MQQKSDAQLLREYLENRVESLFAEIVARHTNLVYSAALRQTNSPDSAAEVTQSVFVALARGADKLAPRLPKDASLAGWLCRSARNISLNHMRDETRRRSRERQAMEVSLSTSETSLDWERLRPVLDSAMADLDEPDYDAVVMRFYKNHDFRSVGEALGVSDDAAQKRVSRALDKLRERLAKLGFSSTAAALSTALSANAVQSAPAGLAGAVSTASALAGTSIPISTAIKTIAMTTLQKTIIGIASVTVLGAGIYEARQNAGLRQQVQSLQIQNAQVAQLQQDTNLATKKISALEEENRRLKSSVAQLPKLRGENVRLRNNPPVPTDPTYAAFKKQLENVKKLKQRVADSPQATIPEFRLLTDADYDDAIKGMLSTEEDYLRAMSNLRSFAEFKFITTLLNPALTQYAKANNGQFPSDFSQLQPYFPSPVEDAILQRWEFAPANTVRTDNFGDPIITQAAAVDADWDPRYAVGPKGFASAGVDTAGHNGWGVVSPEIILGNVAKAYAAANNGAQPTDPSQIIPYLTTAEEQAAYQKMIAWRQAK